MQRAAEPEDAGAEQGLRGDDGGTGMDARAGAQHSEQEDRGGQQRGAFNTHRRSRGARGLGICYSSPSPRAMDLSNSCSAHLGDAGGGGAIDPRAQMNRVYHGNGAAAVAAGGLGVELFNPGSRRVHMGVRGFDMGRAPTSPGSLSRAMVGGTRMPAMSPANVSAAGTTSLPGVVQPRPALAMPQLLQTTGSGGVGGKRAAAGTLAHEDLSPTLEHESSKQPRTAGPGTSASVSTGGRRKGQLRQESKSCHGWCRTSKPTGNVRHACQGCGVDEGGEARACSYWLCQRCLGRWREKSRQSGGFWCCLHEGREWCPCKDRVSKTSKPASVVDRSRLAQNRQESTDVYEFPTPTTSPPTAATTAASPRPCEPGTTFSVCTSNSQNRVAVIKAGDRFKCSRNECRRVESLRSAETGDTESALPPHCAHADVVRVAERTSTEIPKAETLVSGEGFASALAKVPAGIFNPRTVAAMRARADQAAKEGMPLLVRVGNKKFFAVRDGQKFNRTAIDEWAHVKYEKGGRKMFQCKASNGSPCSDSSSRKNTGRCVHAAIVAVYIYDRHEPGVAGQELERSMMAKWTA